MDHINPKNRPGGEISKIPSNCNNNNGSSGYKKSTEEGAYLRFLKLFRAHKVKLVDLLENLA
jgi:hypothetical protein